MVGEVAGALRSSSRSTSRSRSTCGRSSSSSSSSSTTGFVGVGYSVRLPCHARPLTHDTGAYIYIYITIHRSRAGQAGGGSFKEKNYKSKKEFAYRMCTR